MVTCYWRPEKFCTVVFTSNIIFIGMHNMLLSILGVFSLLSYVI